MSPRSRFVLVHGTFHGGWCWQRVADRLRRAGSCVYTPTLAGLAERACELSAAIGLESHVADLASLLLDNDLYDVVLVGHSYGGMVVTGAADRCRERIRTLVYLDATIPVSAMSHDALRGAWAHATSSASTVSPASPCRARPIPSASTRSRNGDGWRNG